MIIRKLIPVLLLVPLTVFSAWIPQCSFIVKIKKQVAKTEKIGNGYVGNLLLLNCNNIDNRLPNFQWLHTECSKYQNDQYPVIIVGGDESASECKHLANQKIGVNSAKKVNGYITRLLTF